VSTVVEELEDEGPGIVPPGASVRRWLHAWLFDQHIDGNYHRAIDRLIGLLIVSNLFALLFEHVPAVYEPWRAWFHGFDVVSVVIFTLEYLLRLYVAPEDPEFSGKARPHWAYVRSPFALMDLVAIAPFYLSMLIALDLRMLRALRLLRIFKLMRVLVPAVHEFQALNRGRSFRQKVHALVWPSDHGGDLHHHFDTFIVLWVVVSVLAVILESVESIQFVMQLEFIVLDTMAVTVFTTEYLMRIYSAVEQPRMRHPIFGRIRFAKTPSALIDLLAILPFFLEVLLHHIVDLRFLRVFRLMRLLKLTRYTGATKTLARVIRREWPVLGASAFVMLLLVVLTASLGYLFEHEAQPDKFENIPQSIYWAVVTLASVGYGDISPVTPMGRAMTIVLALLGIGIFAIPAALLSSAFTDQLRIERETLQNELYNMLADGIISDQEQEILLAEAKRLHLSQEEVDRLIEKARRQREQTSNHALMSMPQLIAQPAAAVERYRELLSQIRQLSQLCDAEKMGRIIADPEKCTGLERAVWQRLIENAPQNKPAA
jgi:voltage-gated potassium channel Kch